MHLLPIFQYKLKGKEYFLLFLLELCDIITKHEQKIKYLLYRII